MTGIKKWFDVIFRIFKEFQILLKWDILGVKMKKSKNFICSLDLFLNVVCDDMD